MRRLSGAMALALGVSATGAAAAAPAVEIDNAVARVIVSPEPRGDVKVEVVRPNPRLPLRIWSFAGRTYVDGGLWRRIRDCSVRNGAPSVFVAGLGAVDFEDMPQIVIHTPMDARVAAGGAVFGQVGRSDSLELANAGCGAWEVANVRGRLKVSQAGSGQIRAGEAGQAQLSAVGAGSIVTREVLGPVEATNLGSGDIDVGAVNGPFKASIAGSGHVRAGGGHVGAMQAAVAGSGGIALDGVAQSLKASVMGSGDVRVTRVTGPVAKAIVGGGEVRVGS